MHTYHGWKDISSVKIKLHFLKTVFSSKKNIERNTQTITNTYFQMCFTEHSREVSHFNKIR